MEVRGELGVSLAFLLFPLQLLLFQLGAQLALLLLLLVLLAPSLSLEAYLFYGQSNPSIRLLPFPPQLLLFLLLILSMAGPEGREDWPLRHGVVFCLLAIRDRVFALREVKLLSLAPKGLRSPLKRGLGPWVPKSVPTCVLP